MTLNCPCEIIVWRIIPAIRRELAKTLIEDFGLTQKEVAEKLGLTEAAVSRYVSGQRADFKVPNGRVSKEIKNSTKKILKGSKKTVIKETCRICDILKSNNLIKEITIDYICELSDS
jgi:predicted transcriptional regulator